MILNITIYTETWELKLLYHYVFLCGILIKNQFKIWKEYIPSSKGLPLLEVIPTLFGGSGSALIELFYVLRRSGSLILVCSSQGCKLWKDLIQKSWDTNTRTIFWISTDWQVSIQCKQFERRIAVIEICI